MNENTITESRSEGASNIVHKYDEIKIKSMRRCSN